MDDEYNSLSIAQMETVFCTAETGPLANRPTVQIADLAGEPLVLFQDSFFQNTVMQEAFFRCGITPNVIFHSGQLSTVFSFIQSHTASRFLFQNVAKGTPGIQTISLDPPLVEQISLVWKRGSFLFSDMNRFIQCIQTFHFAALT